MSSKAEDISMELARYVVAGLPMPEKLMNDLMRQVCEDVKKEREGGKPSSGTKAVA